jgi:translation initiation factor IF-3
VNEQIRVREVLVIGEDGNQLGVMPPGQALQAAREAGLDLVEVAPTARPPVCRIMDYGRYRYLATKKDRESRKGQKTNVPRQIRFKTRIAEHDRQAKLKRIRRFLEDGNKVKLSVMFRGREITHPEIGMNLLRSVVESLKGEAKVEYPPAMEGRFLNVTVSPELKREAKSEPDSEEGEQPDGQAADQKPEEVKA